MNKKTQHKQHKKKNTTNMMNLQFELLRLGISKIAGDLGISSYENIIPANTVRRLLKCLKHENRTRRHRPRHDFRTKAQHLRCERALHELESLSHMAGIRIRKLRTKDIDDFVDIIRTKKYHTERIKQKEHYTKYEITLDEEETEDGQYMEEEEEEEEEKEDDVHSLNQSLMLHNDDQ